MEKTRSQAGFTLLEILLVIVMIAVTSAMIVPSIQISGASVMDETKRLRAVMRYAMEESQLSGVPIRWSGTKRGWHFEYLEKTKDSFQWLPFEDAPVETYALADGIVIVDVEQAGEFTLDIPQKLKEKNTSQENKAGKTKKEAEPVIGTVLLLPDGTTSQSNIKLTDEDDEAMQATLEVRPGPAGIKILKETE